VVNVVARYPFRLLRTISHAPIEIVGVSLLHTGWGVLLIQSEHPLIIASLARWGTFPVDSAVVGVYFIGAAGLATYGASRTMRVSPKLLLWQLPQISIVLAAMWGTAETIVDSHFHAVPSVEVPREAVVARGLYPFVLMFMYVWAWTRFAIPLFESRHREQMNGG
jgi:hypothetical protein